MMFYFLNRNILFIPRMSAILPKGSSKTPRVRAGAVASQVMVMASARNSRLMTGVATARPENTKAVKKAASEMAARAMGLCCRFG